MEDDLNFYLKNSEARKQKQVELKNIPIVQEALDIFSETKSNLNWTKKTLYQRIMTIQKWGKLHLQFLQVLLLLPVLFP